MKKKKQSLTDFLTADDRPNPAPAGENRTNTRPEDGAAPSYELTDFLKAEKKRLQSRKKAEKKAAKRAKKAERAKQRAIRRHENAVLYSPDKMKGFPLSIGIGYFFRFFSIAFSIFGIMVLMADSFLTTELNYAWLLLYSVVAVTAFSLIFIGRKLILAGVGLLTGTVGALAILWGSPAALYVGGFVRLFNESMDRLADAGFASAEHLAAPALGTLSASNPDVVYLYGGLFAVITLLALIFSALSAKRTRLFPMLLLGGGLCAVCFTYNLCRSNFGIACILAGLCSAIVLSTYDRIYADHKKSRKSRGYSGFSSALAGLLAFAVLLAPASRIDSPWRTISFISEPMSDLRMIVTTLLTGGNPKLNVMNTLTKSKDASLNSVEFENIPLFTVSSYLRRQNIYLRSWIADDYDYASDSWAVLSDEDYSELQRSLKGTGTGGITGDLVNYQLASLFNNWLSYDALPRNSFSGSADLGYYFSYVDVEYTGNTGQLYALPSSFIPSIGLFEYGSRTDRYDESWNLYSDGIYRSSWTNLKKSYTAGALIPTYLDKDFAKMADERARAYAALTNFFLNGNLAYASEEEITAAYNEVLRSAGVSTTLQTPLHSFLEAKQSGSWRTWRRDLFENTKQYADYVKDKYTVYPSDSEGIRQISAAIRPSFDAAQTQYDQIMAVIDYMILNYAYTTTPTEPSGSGSNLDAFLLETKDGYCVQFATAAALLLRSLGIPARYVQGYIADDRKTGEDAEGNVIYESTVLDTGAHAWVEVWMDGLGWRTFEVTPAYYQALYYIPTASPETGEEENRNPIIDVVVTTQTPPTPTLPETYPELTVPEIMTSATDPAVNPEEDDAEEKSGGGLDPQTVLTVVGIAIGTAGVLLLIFWRIRKARKIAAGRKYFIERAIFGTFADQEDLDLVSGALAEGIYSIMKILGKVPRVGETPCEFAHRVDHPKKPENKAETKAIRRQLMWAHTFTEVTHILEKREFLGQIDRAELSVLGEFLESIERVEYPALAVRKKLYYRYIRCVI